MLVTIPSVGTTDEFGPFTLQKGETRILQTDGSGTLSAGSAFVEANGTLGVSAVFSLYDTQKNFLTEAGVGSAESLTDFVIPVDAAGSFNTGVALVNPGQADASVTYRLVDSNGQVVETQTATLGPRQHRARFVVGPGELFPNIGNFQGTLQVTSTQPLAAMTLRQNGAPLSYTTLPVVSKGTTGTSFNLPQVANGTDPAANLKMRTTFIVFNLAQTPANVDFQVRKPDGTAFPLSVTGKGNTNGTFSQNLPAGGSAFLQTDGSGPLSVGSAQISSNTPVGVSAIFTLYGGNDFLTEAGVGDSPTRTDFTLPVDVTGSFSTGVAFFNPGDAPVNVSVRLLDEAGNRLAESVPLELAPRSQVARFVSELFSGQTGLRGSLAVRSSGPIAAVTLRQNFPPLTYTTLPVVVGTSSGTLPPGTPLMVQSKVNLNAGSDLAVDAQLEPGFKISGVLGGRITRVERVFATNAAGEMFPGQMDHSTGRYEIVVRPGNYTLSTCYQPRKSGALNLPYVLYTDPSPVAVSTNVPRDLAVPDVTLQTLRGSVTGFEQLPANTGVSIAFGEPNGSASLIIPLAADGSYEGLVPPGSYTASLIVLGVSTPNQPKFGVYSLSAVPIVVAGTTGANFTIPARSNIHGKVRMADLSAAPINSVVSSLEPQLANLGKDVCNVPIADNLAAIDATGNYEMMLANGKSYQLALTVPQGSGIVHYATGRTIENLSGARVEDFLLPALPGAVTISGKVTNPEGVGLKGVTVTAETDKVTTDTTGIGFSSSTVTDDSGNYAISVLKGTEYRLKFTPAGQ